MTILRVTSMNDVLIESLFAILIVFFALALLVLAFNLTGWINKRSSQKRMVKSGKPKEEVKNVDQVSANEVAAISAALHMFMNEVHDNESNVITIRRTERRYSPWNSKIYGLTNLNK